MLNTALTIILDEHRSLAAVTHGLRFLVREKDYPVWLLEAHFDPAFAVRGLILDGDHGNLLKLAAAWS